jgi:hypothetical protein
MAEFAPNWKRVIVGDAFDHRHAASTITQTSFWWVIFFAIGLLASFYRECER